MRPLDRNFQIFQAVTALLGHSDNNNSVSFKVTKSQSKNFTLL